MFGKKKNFGPKKKSFDHKEIFGLKIFFLDVKKFWSKKYFVSEKNLV